LTTVIAWRRHIEERDRDAAQGASDDESQSISRDAVETLTEKPWVLLGFGVSELSKIEPE
jgi:hypothetical protein